MSITWCMRNQSMMSRPYIDKEKGESKDSPFSYAASLRHINTNNTT